MADIEQLIAEYAELDIEIGRAIADRRLAACGRCVKPCCRPDVCRQVLESFWLRRVSEHVHGRWWPDDWETRDDCIAMTPSGCLLAAGRPAICRSFVCDFYTEAYGSLWEAAFVSFVSDLTWEVGQLSHRVHIEQLEEGDLPKYADRIAERIADGRRLFERARHLLDDGIDELARHRILLELLCRMPRCFRATTRRALLTRLEHHGKGPT